ncbi:DUF6274 family protein [Streptomyces alkaliterrae]|uniref:Uncharacterized protein n=1 Tax=Streptomyces alkaliterrae TaxID=2213162 RepID=A0A5P0YYW0_9ACTN|nr:DUF6274 family protein [Streptomyces alkaliterrae]MBB1254737.1 hypothetical protein [Streptomyces alkaliterrae]MBB1260602.1 hypothetical protein [Streptomyces alkaliterrae]MQS03659.1 hypothetical protein [Streptomyces alkaliterrae]
MAATRDDQGNGRHATRALLRAHLSAAVRHGHSTRRCVICHRLRLLAAQQPEQVQRAAPEPAAESDGG